MSIAFNLLIICAAIVPGLTLRDGLVAQSVIAALAAVALALVGISARATDVNFAAQVTRRLWPAAAVPAIWMIIQILPMPFASHSIWINANEALSQQSWGHISVDIGATIQALVFYLGNVALIAVGIFVVRDRRRAELALSALAAVATLTVLEMLIAKSGLIAGVDANATNEILGAVSSLGILLLLTCGVRVVERYESRREDPTRPAQDLRVPLAACGGALLVCIAGFIASATLNTGLAAAFGAVTFGSVQAIRRAGLASWAVGTSLITMIAAAAMIIFWRYDSTRALSPFLQFATPVAPDAISVAQRLLSDTGWAGTGAGTYTQLLPVYQGLGSPVTQAPTTISALAIELGLPMAAFTIAIAVGLIVKLYRGALARGRDSFYPAAGAACAIVILGQAFCDASLLQSGVAVVGDIAIGMGLAQSVSRGDGP